jgi:hypothetical protein
VCAKGPPRCTPRTDGSRRSTPKGVRGQIPEVLSVLLPGPLGRPLSLGEKFLATLGSPPWAWQGDPPPGVARQGPVRTDGWSSDRRRRATIGGTACPISSEWSGIPRPLFTRQGPRVRVPYLDPSVVVVGLVLGPFARGRQITRRSPSCAGVQAIPYVPSPCAHAYRVDIGRCLHAYTLCT